MLNLTSHFRLRFLDYMLVLGVFFLGFVNGTISISFIVFAIILSFLLNRDFKIYNTIDIISFLLFSILPTILIVSLYVHQPLDGIDLSASSNTWFWMLMLACSILIYFRSTTLENSFRLLRYALPFGLLLFFIILSIANFSDFFQSPLPCRITGFTDSPFTPALVFSAFSVFYLCLWSRLSQPEKYLAIGFLFLTGVVVVAYTQARGISLGFAAALSAIYLIFILSRPEKWLICIIGLPLAVVASLGASSAVDTLTGCRSTQVFNPLFEVASDVLPTRAVTIGEQANPVAEPETSGPSEEDFLPHQMDDAIAHTTATDTPDARLNNPSFDPSVDGRLIMWELGLDIYTQSPLFGSGRWAEEVGAATLADQVGIHDHVHQQYISWLIWFGIPGLMAGIAFLFAAVPWVLYGTRGTERLLLMVASSGVLPVALLFDSLLRLSVFLLFSMLYQGLIIAYCRWCWLENGKYEP